MVNPILKWAGGKRQLLREIHKRIPEKYGHYYEPFIGGGALLFDLMPGVATINDTNPRLINFYTQVKLNPKKIIQIAKTFVHPEVQADKFRDFSKINRKGKEIKNYYYQQREIFNKRPMGDDFDLLEEAALFLYLNRTCYNGLYRENSSGGFNVPIGRYKNPDWVREKEIMDVHHALEDVVINLGDFDFILNQAKSGDLVYFDPPYEPMSKTANFTDYNAEGFDIEDQKRLLNIIKKLDKNGVYFILSNSGVMYERYENAGFDVEIVQAKRAINSNASKRGNVDEIIATNIN